MIKGMYYRYKAEGRCVICGAKLGYGYKYVKCAICRESGKREWYRRKEDRYSLPDDAKVLRDMRKRSLDDMAREAHERNISYGKLQCEETSTAIREFERLRREV